jgi:RNA polymerase sigma-70 factor (ECF subfamily)
LLIFLLVQRLYKQDKHRWHFMGNQTEASSNVMERFEQLYLETSPKLYRFFSARVSDDDIVEDLTAETFFRARRKWPPRESEPHQVQAWLFQIGRNLLIDHYRSNGRCRTEPLEEDTAHQPQADPGHEHNIETLALKIAMQSLSEQDQDVLALRLAGLANREIAEVLAMNEGAAAMACLRAIGRLKQKLESHDDELG